VHLLAGGKFKRAIFAGNTPERTLDGTNNGALRGFFSGPRAMRNGLETRNGVGGDGYVRYGYPCLPLSGRSNFSVYNRGLLGLCTTTFVSFPDE
jgi:hypothetical protein